MSELGTPPAKRQCMYNASICDHETKEPTVGVFNFKKENKQYVQQVTDADVPMKYICSKNYDHAKNTMQSYSKVMFSGPKGVGKSVCLFFLWQEYLLNLSNAILLTIQTIKDYFISPSIPSYLKSVGVNISAITDAVSLMNILAEFIQEKKPIVLIDLSLMTEEQDIVVGLLKMCRSASVSVLSLSSGAGVQFTGKTHERFTKLLISYQSIEFKPFTKSEAVLFVKVMYPGMKDEKSCIAINTHEDALDFLVQIKPYARRNPYLLNSALTRKTIGDSFAVCSRLTKYFIKQTLPQKVDHAFVQHAGNMALYFHYANENTWIDSKDYFDSFVHDHRLTYVVHHNTETDCVKIKVNFPLVPRLLRDYLYLLGKNKDYMCIMSKNPAVKGYITEEHFFSQRSIPITYLLKNGTSTSTVTFPSLLVSKENAVLCKKMVRNTLYHLRDNHPVIDGVGLLRSSKEKDWLVFVQVSRQSYQQHSLKLDSLFADKRGTKGYKEIPSTSLTSSLFEYYLQLTGSDKFRKIYLYASTKTYFEDSNSVFANIIDNSQQKCKVGLLSKDSEVYKELIF